MLKSLYSGVSGMKGFQTKLDVIGNNIANVNTVGFKKGRVMFQDLLSQNLSGATAPDDTIPQGGVNKSAWVFKWERSIRCIRPVLP